jgi:hypothetical protein
MKKSIFCLYFICLFQFSYGQTIYVNSRTGNDQNSGTIKEPLKTLEAGMQLLNKCAGNDAVTLKLAPGLYPVQTNLTIEPNKNLTSKNRLTIEADILPDDSTWRHAEMPTIISTSLPEDMGGDRCTYTFNVNADHVTIRGIKFLGNPSLTTKHFPVYRPNDTLTDLIVAQCVFLGDEDALPIQVAVMVNGHNTEIENCVFSNCRWAAIFFHAEGWKVPIKNSCMHHCIITDCYGGAIWTSLVGSDFRFYKNIINKCRYFWVKNYSNNAEYTIEDCVVSNVNVYKGEWKENNNIENGSYNFVEKNIIKDGSIELVKRNDSSYFTIDRNFLHPVKGSLGVELNAGIFMTISK